jgi:hypothetical protein
LKSTGKKRETVGERYKERRRDVEPSESSAEAKAEDEDDEEEEVREDEDFVLRVVVLLRFEAAEANERTSREERTEDLHVLKEKLASEVEEGFEERLKSKERSFATNRIEKEESQKY